MKNIVSILLFFSILSSCTHEYETAYDEDKRVHKLVIAAQYDDFTPCDASTRVSVNGVKTTFTTGDRIGVYVVGTTGTISIANLCLTYDGTSWNYPSVQDVFYYDPETTPRMKFFAYYPYQETLDNLPALGATPTTTSASAFFNTLIENWEPASDQSTLEKYIASDLMVAVGAFTQLDEITYRLKLTMKHRMAKICLTMPYWYLSTNSSVGFTPGLTINDKIMPYHSNSLGSYYCIVKPSTPINGYYCLKHLFSTQHTFSVSGIQAGYYRLQTITGDVAKHPFTPSIGDYLLNDGSIIPQNTTNIYILQHLKRAVGVIFSTTTSATDAAKGWKSGYAVSLQDIPGKWAWSNRAITEFSNYTDATTINNKDGYTETTTITNGSAATGYTADNYPAFYQARNYGNTVEVPVSTSGWFLPSAGQWYDILKNLAGLDVENTDDSTKNYAELTATALNAYLLKAQEQGASVTPFSSSDSYVCSTKYSNNGPFRVEFSETNGVSIDAGSMDTPRKVRPVIAF